VFRSCFTPPALAVAGPLNKRVRALAHRVGPAGPPRAGADYALSGTKEGEHSHLTSRNGHSDRQSSDNQIRDKPNDRQLADTRGVVPRPIGKTAATARRGVHPCNRAARPTDRIFRAPGSRLAYARNGDYFFARFDKGRGRQSGLSISHSSTNPLCGRTP